MPLSFRGKRRQEWRGIFLNKVKDYSHSFEMTGHIFAYLVFVVIIKTAKKLILRIFVLKSIVSLYFVYLKNECKVMELKKI